MSKQTLQLLLTADEQHIIIVSQNKRYIEIRRYNLQHNEATKLYETTNIISHVVRCEDVLLFVENNELQRVQISDGTKITMNEATSVWSYDEQSFVYVAQGNIYKQTLHSMEATLLANDIDRVVPSKGAFILYEKQGKLHFIGNCETSVLPLLAIESAASSFDGQYIALYSMAPGERHFYVYDVQMNILQNMTELLGEQIGYTGEPLSQAIIELPVWTETNAFYFLVCANDEVRLYYGDLYGTLLPASPEEQQIYTYAIAKSGNWAITALKTNDEQYKILSLDITTGENLEIYC